MKISLSRQQKSKKGNDHGWFVETEIKGLDHFADLICQSVWSPPLWASGRRVKANFISCKYLTLDFDSGFTLVQGVEWLEKNSLAGIIGTSKSHQIDKVTPSGATQKACDRYRLVTPFTEDVTHLGLYEATMKRVMEELPCDTSCKDGARFFYPCKDIYYRGTGGGYAPLSSKEFEDMEIIRRQHLALVVSNKETRKRSGTLPPWIHETLNYGVKENDSRHTTAYRIGAELGGLGYTPEEITQLLMTSNIKHIGEADVRRAVRNGWERARQDG